MSSRYPVALLINDIHVSKDTISEFRTNWNEAIDICVKRNIPEIIVGGDLWYSRSAQTLSTLMAVREAIIQANSKDITLTIAEGNHDLVDQESCFGYSHLFSEYPNVFVVDDYTIIDIGDNAVLYVMSYFPENGSFIERLNGIVEELDKSKTNVLYIHEGINGGLAYPSDDELPASIFEPFDHTLVGHYHNRKIVEGTNIEYIGASRQHNFGEDELKGYTVLYSDGSYEFVQNMQNTRYKVIDIAISDIDEEFYNRLLQMKQCGWYKIKVRIKCNSNEIDTIDKQKCIERGATKIEFVTEQIETKLTQAQDISQKFDKSGIKQEYVEFCADRAIANVDMGLAYLDKIN